MAQAVKSDGSIQKLFDEFLTEFDTSTDSRIDKAIAWFTKPKENGRERLDDVNLPSLYKAGAKFYEKFGTKAADNPPAIIKKYTLIKLQQGKATWLNACTTPETNAKPWDK